jgi:diaminohydroxyphosphoribosylaminopyrimidine deaminase/5-amino-6-(5-phosphoribosylamino)uracil reductase
MNDLKDHAYMEMAFALAEKARGRTSPNPYVGAVIVKNGSIVGWGYHARSGQPHAESVALDRAGPQAQGATAYVTLEPCTHWGRTPPCVDRLIRAGVKRVVISDIDPNPLVNRKGVNSLRRAGIAVTIQPLADKNRKLNEVYTKYITRNIPFVTLKAAMSLDGKIATHRFHSNWISSQAAREYMHLVRGEHDAIMVGINTLIKDDPRLSVRHPHWRNKRLLRIILDPHLRMPQQARIFGTLSRGDILILTQHDPAVRKAKMLENQGAKIHALGSSSGKLNLEDCLVWLGKNEISSVLVEGGGRVLTSFLEKGLADKLLLSISPKLIGGDAAPGWFQGRGTAAVSDALRFHTCRTFSLGADTLCEGYL